MKRKWMKDFFMKKRSFIFGATFVVALIAVVLLTFVVGVQQAIAITKVESLATQETITLSQNNVQITQYVDGTHTYVIDGSGISWSNVSIIFEPTSVAVTEVRVVIKNLVVTNSEDIPVLEFKPSGQEVICNYKLSVSGSCRLESTCQGGRAALISAEKVNTSVVELKESEKTAGFAKLSDILVVTESFQSVTLDISSDTAEPGKLILITARDSYGAAIGADEAEMDQEIILSPGNESVNYSHHYGLDENGVPFPNNEIKSSYDYLNERFGTNYTSSTVLAAGKQFLVDSSVNCADITINKNIEIDIMVNGYGAGIGGGGSLSVDYQPGKAGIITLKDGTVAIKSTGIAPCIGSGRHSNGQAGSGNTIIVDGGSLYMEGAVQYDGEMRNSHGSKVYPFTVDLTNATYDTASGLYVYTISNQNYYDSYTYTYGVDVNHKYDGEIQLGMVGGVDVVYSYEGYGNRSYTNAGISTAINDKLYFYLPATPISELTISDSSYIKNTQRIEVYQDGTQISSVAGRFQLKAGIYADLRVYDVPEAIDVKLVILNGQIYPVEYIENDGDPYYLLSFKMPEVNAEAIIEYAGNIPIVYNDGYLETDTTDHVYIPPLGNIYNYGSTLTLEPASSNDLEFDGWYITGTDTPITEITPDDILDGTLLKNGKIELTARWKCKVNFAYDIEEGPSGYIGYIETPYGQPYTFDPASPDIPTPPVVEYFDFVGWSIDGTIYTAELGNNYYVNSMCGTLTVNAEYKKNRYYIYIDKTLFDKSDVTLMMGTTEVQFDNGEYIENGVAYYRGLVTAAVDRVDLSIAALYGYTISPTRWSVSITYAKTVTDSWNDNTVTYQMLLDGKDIYVKNNNSAFIPKTYTVTFYDGVDANNPWKTVEYNIEMFNLPVTLDQLLDGGTSDVETRYDRFHRFVGWKAILAAGEGDPFVTEIDSLGNYIFVGIWEETERYPIDITVYDAETNEISENIGAVPFLYDEITKVKTPIEVVQEIDPVTGEIKYVTYVIPGDNIFIELVVLDDNGNFLRNPDGSYIAVGVGNGFEFAEPAEAPYDYAIKYTYMSENDEYTIRQMAEDKLYISVPDDIRNKETISIYARIKLIRFTIQYWDLRGYSNENNPTTYTVFDEFEFVNIADGVTWNLVTRDDDDSNYDDVREVPITGVSKWSSGNLVLKPNWTTDYIGLYNIGINIDEDAKGDVSILAPIVTDGYRESQAIIVRVNPEIGYKLVTNSLVYTKTDMSSVGMLSRNLMAINNVSFPCIITPIDEEAGVYMFMMPGSDVEITAQFEVQTYDIIYQNVEEGIENANPTTYTIEDDFVLMALSKEGYIFKGWMDEDGEVVTTISGNTGNLKLSPIWKAVEPPTVEEESSESEVTSETTEVTTEEGTSEEEETSKIQFIGGDSSGGDRVQTGDNTNVVKLIVILLCAATLLVFIVVKKKDNEKTEDEN